ncbi:MAG: DNA polymerase III subunit alpha [Verrucomicrobia bacterium]|nr:DNA polymerase III subunit alpha [Verrucomicrobiota bacterium]
MSNSQFVHLHVHSQYSILDASASIPGLIKKAAHLKMAALALTDHGNLYGAVDFYKGCKEHSIKPLIGCEFYVAPQSRLDKKKQIGQPIANHLTIIAKNKQGYHNLCKLSSIGYIEGFYYYPRIDMETLARHKEGLICLSGCLHSQIAYLALNSSKESLLEAVTVYKELFGEDFYFELQQHKSTNEELQLDGMFEEVWLNQQYQDYVQKQQALIDLLVPLGRELGISCVATNNVHYLEREEWRAHEILLNVQSGEPVEIWQRDSFGNPISRSPNPRRATQSSHEMYFKTAQEMASAFSEHPELLETTLEIADKCSVEIDLKTKHYPIFTPEHLREKSHSKEEHLAAVDKFLWDLAEAGISKRYTEYALQRVSQKYPERDPLEVVRERLKYEMEIICSRGMCDYLLIVWDFIHWSKENGIPMGPGRGSGVGSIVLYLIGITDIEPLQFSLFFERFINPERPSYPDIDVDICMARRGEVINYTIQRFGKENVAQIITFGSMKARMCVKDVGRVLSIPLSKVNQIAKLIPEDLNITLEKALEKDLDLQNLYRDDEEARRVIDIGKQLEGSVRSTGLHAAGMIVSGEPLTDHVPVCLAKDSDMLATQFAMKPVELAGMLKIDFLGLKTLTCIQLCADAIEAQSGTTIDWVNLPIDDARTFSLLNQGQTLGVFQIETGGMQELARQLHLDKFEEIIAVLSLYRPGPMDMIPSFIARKHGREPIEYDHPWMKEILSETYGIMVYQEQVMQIAQKLASYSLGEGDVLRRAMGKKDMKEMVQQREKFIKGAVANEVSEEVAGKIFDKMEKFAEYGFNKSHATAYGYLTYVTAYLKAHAPSQWLAALMTCDRDDTTKVAKFFHESRQMQIAILQPDINESESFFASTPAGIRFAMSGIKGVGEGVVEAILEQRKKNGPFTDLYHFVSRIDTKRVGKKATELLIDAGCFDSTGWHRDALKLSLEAMYDKVQQEQKEKAKGIVSLFAKYETTNPFAKAPACPNPRSTEELLFREKELLGFFLTGHPLDGYRPILSRLGCVPLSDIETMPVGTVFRTAFVIEEVMPRFSSKTQKKFVIMTIADAGVGKYELPVWPELYEELQLLLVENRLVWGVLSKDPREGDTSQLTCRWLGELKTVDEKQLQLADAAYDKAKQQISRPRKQANSSSSPKSDKEPAKTKPQASEAPPLFAIDLDIDQLRASHILRLQALLNSSPGTVPVALSFHSEAQEVATLLVSTNRGVTVDDRLKEEIGKLPSSKKCELRRS